jgi:hypothetical protein
MLAGIAEPDGSQNEYDGWRNYKCKRGDVTLIDGDCCVFSVASANK